MNADEIKARIEAATGATDIHVTTNANRSQWAGHFVTSLGERVLKRKLAAAGFEVVDVTAVGTGRTLFSLNDITPAAPEAATFTVGQRVEATRHIPWGMDSRVPRGTHGEFVGYDNLSGQQVLVVCFPSEDITITCSLAEIRALPQPGDGLPESAPSEGGNVLADAEDMAYAAQCAELAIYADIARQSYAQADAEDRAELAHVPAALVAGTSEFTQYTELLQRYTRLYDAVRAYLAAPVGQADVAALRALVGEA